MLERLQKYLANCGIASRRKAEELIEHGLVKVNGKVVTKLGTKIDSAQDQVEFRGKLVIPRNFVYYLLYKPQGYVATVLDPHAQKIVTQLVPKAPKVYPVGRLDKQSEGLLLLTNDGDFAQKVSHPSFECEKEYEVVINGIPNQKQLKQLEVGVMIEGKKTAPAQIKLLTKNQKRTTLRIILHEGRKRQIRKMFPMIGFEVLNLKRLRIDQSTLGKLQPGQYRELTQEEVAQFKQKKCSKQSV